jgi:magnesium-transporting ATPase (P-type)
VCDVQVAVVTACAGAVALQVSPLSAVQMLWVNLIMDSLASLALATESPTGESMAALQAIAINQPLSSMRFMRVHWVPVAPLQVRLTACCDGWYFVSLL